MKHLRSLFIFLSVLLLTATCFGGGEFTKLNFKGSTASTTDPKNQLQSFSVARDSMSTYIDTDGVLQTLDGDETSDQSSQEDETGYTYAQGVGSFRDDAAWFSGFIPTALSNNVTGITKANPGVVTSNGHGLQVDDLVFFDSLTEMTELNNNVVKVTAVGDVNNFSICDTSGYSAAETTGGACGHSVVSLTQFSQAHLLKVTDSSSKVAYGFTDGTAEAGEALGSNLFDQDGGAGGSGDKGAFTLADLRLAELSSGNLTVGTMYEISAQDGEDFTADGAPDNVVGTTFVATGTNVTLDANDKVYPIDISWIIYSLNTASIDGNALKITHVNNSDAGYILMSSSGDLSANLVPGKLYRVTGQAKVSAGSVYIKMWTEVSDPSVIITSTDFIPFEIYFTSDTTQYNRFFVYSLTSGQSVWLDDLSITEVTAGSESAVTIYSEPTCTTEGWAVIESGFDYNDTSLTFDVYEHAVTTGGGAEAGIEALGLRSDGAGVNYALYCRDMTNAVWAKTNITALKDVTGIDGSANSASRLTASANNGTILQTLTAGFDSATHTYSVWMKRITGSGAIYLTDDNGGNYTEKTLTSSWQRFSVERSQTSPVIGIKMATSGDVIGVDFNQFEANQGYYTSVIPTTTIPSARTATTMKWTMSTAFKNLMGDVADSPFTMIVEWTPGFDYGDISEDEKVVGIAGSKRLFYADEVGRLFTFDGTGTSFVGPDYSSGTTYIFALRVYNDSGMKFEVGEKHGGSWSWDAAPADYDGSFNPGTYLEIGCDNENPFNIGFVYFYNAAKTQNWIENGNYLLGDAAILLGM